MMRGGGRRGAIFLRRIHNATPGLLLLFLPDRTCPRGEVATEPSLRAVRDRRRVHGSVKLHLKIGITQADAGEGDAGVRKSAIVACRQRERHSIV